MKILERNLGTCLLQPSIVKDARGWFQVVFNAEELRELKLDFGEVCQINHSCTEMLGVVRGPNYQKKPYQQAKIVRCTKGAVYSVGIDIDRTSPTYGKWCGFVLDSDSKLLMYIPKTYAHGFITLQPFTELEYFTDEKYCYEAAKSFRFDDPNVGIDWCMNGSITVQDILSDKNRYAPLLKDADI